MSRDTEPLNLVQIVRLQVGARHPECTEKGWGWGAGKGEEGWKRGCPWVRFGVEGSETGGVGRGVPVC